MLMTDLRELKIMLDIDPGDTSEDLKINFFLEQASSWIEEYLGRPGLSYAERTEYYNGTGTRFLLLKSRPVYTTPTIQVWVDPGGNYGSASGAFSSSNSQLTYGESFCLQVDDGTTKSRCGILIRLRDYWYKPYARQAGLLSPFVARDAGSIKIVYTAGYTVDDLPAQIRTACNLLVARMLQLFPTGLELNSESYEERSIGWAGERKNYLMSLVTPLLFNFRNFNFGGGN